MTINIASFPGRGTPNNPYVDLFYDALKPHGIELIGDLKMDLDWLKKNSEQLDAVHLHWPEVLWRIYTPPQTPSKVRSFLWSKLPGAWRIFKFTDTLLAHPWCTQYARFINKIRGYLYFQKFIEKTRQSGIRIIWTFHNAEIHEGSDYIDRKGYQYLAKSADLVIFHSKIAEKDFLQHYHISGRTVFMPHGNYDHVYPQSRPRAVILKELGLREDLPVISCLGMLRSYKGLDFAIKTVALLDKEVQFLCAGSPHSSFDLSSLQKQFDELDNTLLIPNFLSAQEFSDYTAISDCLLMPYKKITGSGALLAALSLSRGVVASDLPYFRELLADHPGAGILVTTESPKLFAQGIREYLTIPSLQRNQAARDLAEYYDWKLVVLPVAKIIESFK